MHWAVAELPRLIAGIILITEDREHERRYDPFSGWSLPDPVESSIKHNRALLVRSSLGFCILNLAGPRQDFDDFMCIGIEYNGSLFCQGIEGKDRLAIRESKCLALWGIGGIRIPGIIAEVHVDHVVAECSADLLPVRHDGCNIRLDLLQAQNHGLRN